MGAIFGIFGEADHAELERMGARLAHRGVEGGVWSVATNVHFGQRFWRAEDDVFTPPTSPIVLAGFIDNQDEIATRLDYAATAEKLSDAELVLELYYKFGAEALRHLSGSFALAIWDARHRHLVLARDVSAVAPLYFTRVGQRYIFASEYKALLAIDSVPARPNRDAIQYLHNTKYVQSDACCLADVFPVPGGMWLEVSASSHVAHRYEELVIKVSECSEATHAETLRQSLLKAAARQTRRYKSIGVALSAGLDSAVTVAALRHAAPEMALQTFTTGFGPDDTDIAEAAAVARHFGTLHHAVFLSSADLPDLLPRMLWHMEDPIGREEKVFYYVLAREAAKYVSVLLAGHNADALFGGMPRHLVFKAAASFALARGPLEELYYYTQTGAPPRSLIGRMLVRAYSRGELLLPPRVLGAVNPPAGAGLPSRVDQPLTALLRESFLWDPNANAAIERIHAAASISFGSLFLDLDLIRCSVTIPDELKIRGLHQKHILRKACTGLLPDAMLRRKKGLLRLRHDKQFCDVLDDLACTLLTQQAVAARALFEPSYVARIRRRPSGGIFRSEQIYRLWSLLLTELWSRLFLDARGAPPE
jgi:asparagine synthase (glutamine-hydrolysing)